MKKLFTIALCFAAVGTMSAQKSVVDQAQKLAGKADKVAEARALIEQAKNNPETSGDVQTYYVAGKIEFDAYDNALKKQMINPNDESVNPLEMAGQLVNGYKEFAKALPLDSVPDAKGKVKAKYSKDMIGRLNGHFNDYFNAGGTFYNAQKYYPEAYEAFMIYGDMSKAPYATKAMQEIPDSIINTAYFNAGLSAYAGNALKESAAAFRKARLNNSDNPQNFIYEIACWQFIAGNDSTMEKTAAREIEEVARAGKDKFGISQPIFMNNLVNSLVLENRMDEAVQLIAAEIASHPDNAALYGLRGYVLDRKGDNAGSVADYRKAAEMADADFETLKNASKKIFKTGTEIWNTIEGPQPEKRNDVKVNYFEAAKKIAEKAKSIKADDSDIDYILENINYALETYFN